MSRSAPEDWHFDPPGTGLFDLEPVRVENGREEFEAERLR
jgi:hypothetical protein